MTFSRLGKKLLKLTGIILGVLVILLTAFHLWFVSRAKYLLEETVEKRSDGKLKLKIENLSYNYFSRRMIIREAVFITTDTLTAPSAYRFAVKEIRIRLKALLPLVLKDQLLIDSLRLQSPDIRVTTLRLARDTLDKNPKDVSIPYEMGKVYNSIQDALKLLRVTRFQIDDGKFTLVNKILPGQVPLHVSNIQVQIDNLQVDTSKLTGDEKLLFSDNVVLRSHHQDILFPDGRHRLAFSGFRINLQSQLVEFDSCTIAATRTDSALSSFHVFFDTLRLTHIDFDTLYRSEVIKADSVYCLNPKFELIAEAGKKKAGNHAGPQLENIVQQLTGNLLLGFVIVENADFNIRVTNNGVPSSYTFTRNNFEMQGLSIDRAAAKPITVKSFAMAIRDYENFLKDSSYSIQFDSVRFKDDQFILSNFLFNKMERGKILNTFRVPRFFLEGLSWDDLVFERKLRARSVVMIEPEINYTSSPDPQKKQNLFQSLGAVNEFMDLDQLDIINGRIDLKLKKDLWVRLENASLSVQSQYLLSSTRLAGIKNSLNGLHFDRGIIQAGRLSVELDNIRYTGENGKFTAGYIHVKDIEQKLDAALDEMTVDKLVVDETNGNVFAEGIAWSSGNIRYNGIAGSRNERAAGSVIELKRIEGNNTLINGSFNDKKFSTRLNQVRLDELSDRPGSKLILKGLATAGQQLTWEAPGQELTVDTYSMTDHSISTFRDIYFGTHSEKMKTSIRTPELSAIPDLNRLRNAEIALDNVNITRPLIDLQINNTGSVKSNKLNFFPVIGINSITITGPVIRFTHQNDSGTIKADWYGDRGTAGKLTLNGLQSNRDENKKLTINAISLQLADFNYENRRGISFQTGEGKMAAQFSDLVLRIKNQEPAGTTSFVWNALLNSFDIRDIRFDSIGKKKGALELATAKISSLEISSSAIGSLQQLVTGNPIFRIGSFTGRYADAGKRFTWSNAGFDRSNNMLTADSFSLRPSLEKDSFLLTRKFQADYMQAGTGPVRIGPIDLDAFLNDTILTVKNVNLTNVYFTDFKDKRLPFNPGIIKPLPADLLKKIPLKVSFDTIRIDNAMVEYTELNEKTKLQGTIPLKRMTISILNAKNFRLKETDSLTVLATGYLMDTLWTNLRIKESYTDSSGGFLMTLEMGPGDMTVLNRVLIPLSSVKLLSADLDTLYLRAVGREYMARGEMKLYYNDLKIQFLKDGKENNRNFRTRILSFLANSLVIKNRNSNRTGDIFFIRHRDRSAINYFLNIALSGISSSVGIKSNKKNQRKYRRELKKKGLPQPGSN